MAHFYAEIQGSRKAKNVCGHKSQGIRSYVRGWSVGVTTSIQNTSQGDTILVQIDGGSNHPGPLGFDLFIEDKGLVKISYQKGAGERETVVLGVVGPRGFVGAEIP